MNEDQSAFIQQAEHLMPPPEAERPMPPETENYKAKKNNKVVVVAIVFLVMIVLLLGVLVLMTGQTEPQVLTAPSPTTATIREVSELERQMLLLDQKLDEANPFSPALDPPPIDMAVEF